MKIVLCLILFAILTVGCAKPPKNEYTTKYDNFDFDGVIKNERLLRNYVDCLLGSKKCTKEGEELKKVLPDALKTGCSKCNEIQRTHARKILHHLIENKNAWYKELEAVYDSEGIYRRQYQNEAKKEGLKI